MLDRRAYRRHRRLARALLAGLPQPRARQVREALAIASAQARAGNPLAVDSAWQGLVIARGAGSEPG